MLKNKNNLVFFALSFLFVATTAQAQGVPSISSTSIEKRSGNELVVFFSSAPVNHQKMFILDGPPRVVLDIDTSRGAGIALPPGYEGGMVRGIRFGQFDPDTSRIVIDLTAKPEQASVHKFSPMGGKPFRLVVDIKGVPGDITAEAPQPSGGGGAFTPTPIQKPALSALDKGKPLIIIDPGHGGKDPGTIGKAGTYEKRVNLEIGEFLRKELLKTGRYRVALTRETDELIALADRVVIARKAGADAFVSLHADSAINTAAKGLSVYTVSEEASDAEAAALAEQENSADIIAGVDLMHENKEVADILIDLAQRDTKNKSSKLADIMVEEFRAQGVTLLPNPHRFAGFRVLKAPDIPSVLIETGFLSHPEDERRLMTASHRERVARGVIFSLDKYFAAQK